MTLILETIFTNPQVTPIVPIPFNPDNPCRERLEGFWYAISGIIPIDKDTFKDLQQRAIDKNVLQVFLVRTASNSDIDAAPETDNPLATQNFFGIVHGHKLHKFTTGTYVEATGALMSTPYTPNEAKWWRNGVRNDGRNIDEANMVWKWDNTDKNTGRFNRIQPREDGSVHVVPQGREASILGQRFRLQVLDRENAEKGGEPLNVNKEVNAFTLVLGIEQGSDEKLLISQPPKPMVPNPNQFQGHAARPPTHQVKIEVSNAKLVCEIMSERNEARIKIEGGSADECVIAIQPQSAGSKMTASPIEYHLTFIPVWNGYLISDQVPSSTNFQDRITYVPKNFKRNAAKEIDRIMAEAAGANNAAEHADPLCGDDPKPPKWGKEGEFLPDCDNNPIGPIVPDFFGNLVDTRKPLVCLPEDPDVYVSMGTKHSGHIDVTFVRCGGSMRFSPVYFNARFRSHLISRGDFKLPVLEPPFPGGVIPDPPAYIFDNVKIPGYYVVPTVYYTHQDPRHAGFIINSFYGLYDLRAGDPTYWTLSQQFTLPSLDFRRPVENWGAMVLWVEEEGDKQTKIQAGEGSLVVRDMPPPRIQKVSINRSLDGSSGSVTWDRYDPTLALFFRPEQNVGAIRILAAGGQDTIPGCIFTGIGYGNAEQDQAETNSITIDLQGREVKMTEQAGGIRIINAPYFDGVDHRCVMQWLCEYVKVPFSSHAAAYKLPAGPIFAPVIDLRTGTAVWDGMGEIQKHAASIAYFDRFGILQYRDVGQTANNWIYPIQNIISYDDKPDLNQMRNTVIVAGLVSEGVPKRAFGNAKGGTADGGDWLDMIEGRGELAVPYMVRMRSGEGGKAQTIPAFEWDKMMFYAIPGIMTEAEMKRAANQIFSGVTRPRSSGSVTIPGNGQIELLDTFNEGWVVTGISHNMDLEGKKWTSNINLELISAPIDKDGPDGADGVAAPPGVVPAEWHAPDERPYLGDGPEDSLNALRDLPPQARFDAAFPTFLFPGLYD